MIHAFEIVVSKIVSICEISFSLSIMKLKTVTWHVYSVDCTLYNTTCMHPAT